MSKRFVFSIVTPSLLGVLVCGAGLTGAAQAAGGKGYTLGVDFHDPVLGIDRVGHGGLADPYQGDTSCALERPVLCIKVDGSPRPPYAPVDTDAAYNKAYYNGWIEGHFARTKPVRGNLLTSLEVANAQCSSSFGEGWRMAEHHDGKYVVGMSEYRHYSDARHSPSPWPKGTKRKYSGGHNMYGYGNLGTDTRFWTYINDQRANCWNP